MNMGALNAQLHDPEVFSTRRGQRRLANRLIRAASTQVADRAHDAERDMHWISRVQHRPLLVRRPGPGALRRPPLPASLAAALLEQRQLLRLSTLLPSTSCG